MSSRLLTMRTVFYENRDLFPWFGVSVLAANDAVFARFEVFFVLRKSVTLNYVQHSMKKNWLD
jgi:hypothetical protein